MTSTATALVRPVIAIAGPRPHKLATRKDLPRVEQYIRHRIGDAYDDLEPELVISGMALGVDQWGVEECVARNIAFIAALPFKGQEEIWTKEEQRHYYELLEKAWRVCTISPGGYSDEKYFVRNRYMVKSADALLAVWRPGMRGGTNSTVQFAREKGIHIHTINPVEAFAYRPS